MRYEIRIGFLSGVEAPCLGTERETVDSFLSLLGGTFKLRKDPFSDPDTHPLSSAVSILGALSSVSQLHCAKSYLLAKPTFLGSSDFPSQPHMHFACSGVTYSEEFS